MREFSSRSGAGFSMRLLLLGGVSVAALTTFSLSAQAENFCANGNATLTAASVNRDTRVNCDGPVDAPPTLVIPNGIGTIETADIVTGEGGSKGVITIGDGSGANAPVVNMVTGDGRLTAINGVIRITGGAQVTGRLSLAGGFANDANGLIEVSGPGSRLDLTVAQDIGFNGQNSRGTLDINNGGVVNVAGVSWFGHFDNSHGTLRVDGAGSQLLTSEILGIGGAEGGFDASGEALVANGGFVQGRIVWVGSLGVGTAQIDGAGSIMASVDEFSVGQNDRANGTLVVSNGGTARAGANGDGTIVVGQVGTGSVVVGSVTDAAGTAAGSLQAGTVLLGSRGTLTFSHNATDGAAAVFASALVSDAPSNGEVRVVAGSTRFTGDSSAFDGATAVDGGTLILAGALGGRVAVGASGTLTLTDGAGAAAVTNNGAVRLDTAGSLDITTAFDGTGTLSKTGVGTVILSGVNGATGAVTVQAGTLRTASSNLVSAASYAVTGGTLDVTDDLVVGKAASIDGAGSLLTAPTVTVASTLQLSNGGVVRVGTAGLPLAIAQGGNVVLGSAQAPTAKAAGIVDADIALAGTLTFSHNATDANALTVANTLTGDGTLAQAAGYTRLSGDLSGFTGRSVVTGGNLALATALSGPVEVRQGGIFTLTDAGDFTGTLDNAGTFAIDTAQEKTLDASGFSGSGALQKDGSGTITLTGTNGASGGVIVNAGTLTGTSAAIGAGALTVNGGTLAATDALTVANATVAGSGAILSAPTLTVAGTDARLTLANGGTARVGGGAGVLGIAANAKLVIGAQNGGVAGGTIEAGSVNLAGGSTLTIGTNATQASAYVLAATLTGDGTLAQTAGYTRLSGDLSGFTGRSVVTGGNLALATALSGPVEVRQGGVFTLTDAGSFTGTLDNAGVFAIDTAQSKTQNVAGFAGSGALQKDGTGTLTLTGANGASGGVIVNAGAVATGVASIGSGPLAVNANGTLVLDDANATATLASTLTGAGTIEKRNANTLTYSGNGAAFTGTTQVQNGDLRLTGTLGGTVAIAQAGKLTLTDTGAVTGTVTNSGTLGVDIAQNKTLAAAFGGSGALQKSGTGTLTLTGANTLAGGLRVDGGTLAVNATSVGTGPLAIAQGATLAYASDAAQSLANTLSGAGTFAKDGTGSLTYTGNASAFTATTDVRGGSLTVGTLVGGGVAISSGATLTLADGGGFGGQIANGGTLALTGTTTRTIANAVTGGDLAKSGSATVTISGANGRFTTVTVDEGTLAGAASSLTASAYRLNGGRLAIDYAGDQALAGTLAGAGTFAKGGAGTLTVSGDNSAFTGAFLLNAGTLRLDGGLGGDVFLANGTTLRGVGSMRSLNVASGSTVTPGNSLGTLTVSGNAVFASGSTYLVEIDATPASDRIAVGGTATLGGATVAVAKLSTAYRPGSRFTILTAQGGVNGTFTGPVQETAPFLDLSLVYDSTHVYLDIARALDFDAVAVTANERAVSPILQALGATNPIYNAILISDDVPTARAAFNSLSGEAHSSLRTVAIENSRLVRDSITDRLSGDQNGGLWAQGIHNWGESDAQRGVARLDRNTTGGVLGFDVVGEGGYTVGLAGGYTSSDVDVAARASSGRVKTIHAGLYAGANVDGLRIGAGASYGWVRNELRRSVVAAGFTDTLRSRYDGDLFQAFGEVSAPSTLGGGSISPFVSAAYIHTSGDRFTEQGGPAALTGRSEGRHITFSQAGVRAETPLAGAFTAHAKVGWQHAYGDVDPETRLTFVGQASDFQILGAPVSRDAGVIALDGALKLSPRLKVSIGYNGLIGSSQLDNAVTARVNFSF